MKYEARYTNAKAILKRQDEILESLKPYADIPADELPEEALRLIKALPETAAVLDAKRQITLYEDVYTRLTEDEIARLKAQPVYSDDVRGLSDVKSKYGISWNELRTMIDGLR